MKLKDILEINLLICILIFNLFVFSVCKETSKKVDAFIKHQESINAKSFENEIRHDKDLRILKQDSEILNRIVTTKTFLEESEKNERTQRK